jgi:hypothetical protein
MREPAEGCKLASPDLVGQLARLGVAPVVALARLQSAECGERATRGLASDETGHECSDERVSAEKRVEPRHTGGDVFPTGVLAQPERSKVPPTAFERSLQDRGSGELRPLLGIVVLGDLVRIACEAEAPAVDLRFGVDATRPPIALPQLHVEDDQWAHQLGRVRIGA